MAEFDPAFSYLMFDEVGGSAEGGYVNNPHDPGGETKWGISKRAYPNVDIKNLTMDGAKAIYQRDFWKFGGIVDQRVASKVFSHFVNREATIRQVQEVVGVTVDGGYGPHTEAAVNNMAPMIFLGNYVNALEELYRDIVAKNPGEAVFLNGWLNRARRLPQ